MGSGLLDSEPVFRQAIDECDQQLAKLVPWSLLAELQADDSRSRMSETAVAQPTVFALQIALAALWRSWGIVPDVVLGHSLGEVAAAHVAGALTLEDALKVVVHRGRLMQSVAGSGKTAAIGLSAADVLPFLKAQGDRLVIAAINGPGQTTVSGDPDAVDELVRILGAREVFARVLPVDCAFHSPQMEPLRSALAKALADIQPRPNAIPLVSTVTGTYVDGRDLGPDYWGQNLRQTVQFASAIEQLADETRTFLEIGPHPALGGAIVQVLRAKGQEGPALASLRRGVDDRESILRSLGTRYTQGRAVAWEQVSGPARHVPLPTYPWQHERFWIDDIPSGARVDYLASTNGNGHSASNRIVRNGHSLTNGHSVAEEEIGGYLFDLAWLPAARPDSTATSRLDGSWLIFSDAGGLGRTLRSRLELRGASCLELVAQGASLPESDGTLEINPDDPSGYERSLAEAIGKAGASRAGVVYLWGLDRRTAAGASAEEVAAQQSLDCERILHLVRAFRSGKLPRRLPAALAGHSGRAAGWLLGWPVKRFTSRGLGIGPIDRGRTSRIVGRFDRPRSSGGPVRR